jgi:ribose transport system ATP-binding protein
VQQDLALIPQATVLENLRLGSLRANRLGAVTWRDERRAASAALETLGVDLDIDAPIDRLSATERALVAVARAISEIWAHRGRGLLVLDEPTAYLPRDGVEALCGAVRQLTAQGTAALFVSHRLDEVLALTDQISVLRDGALVAELETRHTSEDELVGAILGRDLGQLYPERIEVGEDVVASVTGLRGRTVHGVDIEVRAGEIVGLTGITGMGHDEVPYLLFGGLPAQGSLALNGDTLDLSRLTPRRATARGIALLPADRARQSGVAEFSVRENVSLPVLPSLYNGFLSRRSERQLVRGLLDRFDVRPTHADRLRLGQLSGGNQQKALLAKWVQTRPRLLLLHEPTQGVDISARSDVFATLQQLAASGVAVLISSAEHEDLAHVCHRVHVFRHGSIVSTLGGAALTEHGLVEATLRSTPTGTKSREAAS